jgi:aspartyl-tRNA(Asn)/glutamyl-tRNA(Gln) amidotransferase subunit C
MDLQELEETAQLAHLNMSTSGGAGNALGNELAAALPAFEQMLGFFAAMQGADTDPAFAADAPSPALSAGQAAGARLVKADHFRTDLAAVSTAAAADALLEQNEKILNNAGGRDGRFIVIPNVL